MTQKVGQPWQPSTFSFTTNSSNNLTVVNVGGARAVFRDNIEVYKAPKGKDPSRSIVCMSLEVFLSDMGGHQRPFHLNFPPYPTSYHPPPTNSNSSSSQGPSAANYAIHGDPRSGPFVPQGYAYYENGYAFPSQSNLQHVHPPSHAPYPPANVNPHNQGGRKRPASASPEPRQTSKKKQKKKRRIPTVAEVVWNGETPGIPPPRYDFSGVSGADSSDASDSETAPCPPPLDTTVYKNLVLRAAKKAEGKTSTATDVWFWMEPVSAAAVATPNPTLDLAQRQPRLGPPKREEGERLACAICMEKGHWRHWKNDNSSTSRMRQHLERDHKVAYDDAQKTHGLKASSSKIPLQSGARRLFTLEGFYQRLMRWIVVNDQSLNVVNCPEFRDLLSYLNPDVEDHIPHRDKLTEMLFEQYGAQFKRTKADLKASPGRISYTCDMWSRGSLAGYMALTAHWLTVDPITGRAQLKARLVGFRYVPGIHSGSAEANVIWTIINELGVVEKTYMITCDNAGPNDTMMEVLSEKFEAIGIPFDKDKNRVRCLPHVLNIAVTTGLDFLRTVFTINEETVEDPLQFEAIIPENLPRSLPQQQEAYQRVLAADPIEMVRTLVRECRSSSKRREGFAEAITFCNEHNLWGESEPDRPVLELARDVDTRWSTIYNMLLRFMLLWKAVEHFIKTTLPDLAHPLFSDFERAVIQQIMIFLACFNNVQEVAASQKTPTLAVVLPIFDELLDTLEILMHKAPDLSIGIAASILKLREYANRSRKSPAYILALALNHTCKLQTLHGWREDEKEGARGFLRRTMLDYSKSARLAQGNQRPAPVTVSRAPTVIPGTSTESAHNLGAGMATARAFREHLKSVPSLDTDNLLQTAPAARRTPDAEVDADTEDQRAVDAELQAWYSHGVLTDQTEIDTYDPLARWQIDMHKYPILFSIALDILPVQASAVPCERAFSSSKETDTDRRSRLRHELFEILQILKGLYLEDRLDFKESWVPSAEPDYDALSMEWGVETVLFNDYIEGGRIKELVEKISSTMQ